MQDYYNDYQCKFEYDEQVNKIGFAKNAIGPQGYISISETTGYTDDNSIFVNSSSGSDGNPGTQALPGNNRLLILSILSSNMGRLEMAIELLTPNMPPALYMAAPP